MERPTIPCGVCGKPIIKARWMRPGNTIALFRHSCDKCLASNGDKEINFRKQGINYAKGVRK